MTTDERDLEARRHAAAAPLFSGIFRPGSAPTWAELADAAERLRLEHETAGRPRIPSAERLVAELRVYAELAAGAHLLDALRRSRT